MISIRKAESEDSTIMQHIYMQDIRSRGGLFYSPKVIAYWASKTPEFFEYLATGEADCHIAVIDKRPVGFAARQEKNEISHLYVDPVWANMGVAATLLIKMEQAAARDGETRCVVKAPLNATGFFQHMGYHALDNNVVHFAPEARFVCCRMEKPLGQSAKRELRNTALTVAGV